MNGVAGQLVNNPPLTEEQIKQWREEAKQSAKGVKLQYGKEVLPWQHKNEGRFLPTKADRARYIARRIRTMLGLPDRNASGVAADYIDQAPPTGMSIECSMALMKQLVRTEKKLWVINAEEEFRKNYVEWMAGRGKPQEYQHCHWMPKDLVDRYFQVYDRENKASWSFFKDPQQQEKLLAEMQAEFHRTMPHTQHIIDSMDKFDIMKTTFLNYLERSVLKTPEDYWLYYKYIVHKYPIDRSSMWLADYMIWGRDQPDVTGALSAFGAPPQMKQEDDPVPQFPPVPNGPLSNNNNNQPPAGGGAEATDDALLQEVLDIQARRRAIQDGGVEIKTEEPADQQMVLQDQQMVLQNQRRLAMIEEAEQQLAVVERELDKPESGSEPESPQPMVIVPSSGDSSSVDVPPPVTVPPLEIEAPTHRKERKRAGRKAMKDAVRSDESGDEARKLLKEQVETLTKQKAEADEALAKLREEDQKQLAAAKAKVDETIGKLTAKTARITNLNKTTQSLQRDLHEARQKANAAQQATERLTNQLKKLEDVHEKTKAELQNVKTNREWAVARTEAQAAEIATLRGQINGMEELAASTMEAAPTADTQAVVATQMMIAELQQAFTHLEGKFKIGEQQYNDAVAARQQAEAEKQKMAEEIARLQQQLQESAARLALPAPPAPAAVPMLEAPDVTMSSDDGAMSTEETVTPLALEGAKPADVNNNNAAPAPTPAPQTKPDLKAPRPFAQFRTHKDQPEIWLTTPTEESTKSWGEWFRDKPEGQEFYRQVYLWQENTEPHPSLLETIRYWTGIMTDRYQMTKEEAGHAIIEYDKLRDSGHLPIGMEEGSSGSEMSDADVTDPNANWRRPYDRKTLEMFEDYIKSQNPDFSGVKLDYSKAGEYNPLKGPDLMKDNLQGMVKQEVASLLWEVLVELRARRLPPARLVRTLKHRLQDQPALLARLSGILIELETEAKKNKK
jgi:hypothetical protein